MTPQEDAERLCLAEIELDVFRNASGLNVRREAIRDLVDRLHHAGARPTVVGVKMPSGGSALDFARDVIAFDAPHLFGGAADATSGPKPTPIKSKAAGRPTASEKLAAANGDDTEASL